MRIELPDRRSDERAALRPIRFDDAPAYVAAFRDDPDLGRLLGLAVDPDEEQVRARVEGQAERAAEGRGVEFAIAAGLSSRSPTLSATRFKDQ